MLKLKLSRPFALTVALGFGIFPAFAATVNVAATASQEPVVHPNHQLVVISANIHGGRIGGPSGTENPAPLATVKQVINNRGADIALLQEVCSSQLDALEAEYPNWMWAFAPELGTANNYCPGEEFGNVVGSRLERRNIQVHVLPKFGCPPESTACSFRYNMVCANFIVPDHAASALMACSTHLSAGWEDVWYEMRRRQAVAVKNELSAPIASDTAVVLGGDFNATPKSDVMDNIYDVTRGGAFGGPGQFHEADQIRQGQGAQRAGDNTHHSNLVFGVQPPLENKFDYVFFSQNSAAGGPGATDPLWCVIVNNPNSDHEVVVGRTTVTLAR